MSKSKEFLELQEKWYSKLKKKGFNDIEDHDETYRPERDLKEWHSSMFQVNNSPERFQEKVRYYQLAGQFVHEHEFKDELEKLIWQGHSEGLSTREISRRMNQHGYGKDSIFQIVKRLREAMFKTYGVK